MAIRAECPILIYESILEQECLRISNEERRHPEESDEEAEDEKKRDLPRNVTSMSLEEALEQAIKDENYELAAKIRDRINSKKSKPLTIMPRILLLPIYRKTTNFRKRKHNIVPASCGWVSETKSLLQTVRDISIKQKSRLQPTSVAL